VKTRSFIRALSALFIGLTIGAGSAQATDWPNRPIRMIVPAGPGSGTDIMARLICEHLSRALKQPIVIDNKVGANGIIGNDLASKATPDGYTLLFGNASSVSLNAALRNNLPYDTIKDFRPIVQLSNGGILIVADAALRIHTLPEFIAYVRANPGQNYASWGIGSTGHLNMEALIAEYGLKMQHVAYRAMGQILTDLKGNQIKIATIDARSSIPLIKSGVVTPIAMSGSKRGPLFPDVATFAEQGFDFKLDGWYGILGPHGTPEEVVERIHREALKIRTAPELQKTFYEINLPPPPMRSPDQFAQLIKDEIALWRRVVERAGIAPN